MWFWVTMFVCNMMIPALMVVAGYMMYKHTPKKINGIYGYRTDRSMKNEETWKFAHNYCGKLWLKAGSILCVPTFVAMILCIHKSENVVGLVTLIVDVVQIIVLICTISRVESALKKKFDDNTNE